MARARVQGLGGEGGSRDGTDPGEPRSDAHNRVRPHLEEYGRHEDPGTKDGGGDDGEHEVGEQASPWWAPDSDDNYGGGDDNYPMGGVEISAVEREEGHGWDRQE